MKRRRLTYANVMSTIAVFLALGGVSWAAITIPRNSVGALQLKRAAVDSVRVKDGSLLARDFKAGQVFAPRAWMATRASTDPITSTTFVPVASVSVPKGAYAVTAAATLANPVSSPVAVCTLTGSTAPAMDTAAFQSVSLKSAVGSVPVRPVALTSAMRMSAAGTIRLSCSNSGDGSFTAYQANLTAVSVASATVS